MALEDYRATFLNMELFSIFMSKDNKINLPSSGAGLTRYFDNEQSKVMISPQATIFIILAVIVVILLLTSF